MAVKLSKWKPWRLEAEYDLVKPSHGQGQLRRRLVVNTLTPPSGDVLVETEPSWEGEWAHWIPGDAATKTPAKRFAAGDGSAALVRVMEEDREVIAKPVMDHIARREIYFREPRRFFLVTQQPDLVFSTGLFDAPCGKCNGEGWGMNALMAAWQCSACNGSGVRRLKNVVLTLPHLNYDRCHDLAQHFAGVAVYRDGVVEYRGEALEVEGTCVR